MKKFFWIYLFIEVSQMLMGDVLSQPFHHKQGVTQG